MTGHELSDMAEERALLAYIAEAEVLRKQFFFQFRGNPRVLEERFDLRGEGEQASIPEIIEGLDAEPVTRAEQSAAVLVPDREGEHSSKLVHALRAIFLVGVKNRFGIG